MKTTEYGYMNINKLSWTTRNNKEAEESTLIAQLWLNYIEIAEKAGLRDAAMEYIAALR